MTAKTDAEDFIMQVKLRLAKLEERVRKLEQGDQEPPANAPARPAHSSAAAEFAHNANQRLHESKANWK